jgi:hypothetical protein
MKTTITLAVLLLAGGLRAEDTTLRPEQDTTTVLHNPAMGFVTYSDLEYSLDFVVNPNPKFAAQTNVAYFRTKWANLEPTEGNYLWQQSKVQALIQGLKARHIGMALRVMVQYESATPAWVLEAVRAAGQNPMSKGNPKYPDITNPIWQKKFESFVMAFGKAFDDPAIVDYIDANGIGDSGEGNCSGLATPEESEAYIDWHYGLYARAFKRVLLDANYGVYGKDFMETDKRIALNKYGMIFRNDGLGSSCPSEVQLVFMNQYFPRVVGIGEKCSSFGDPVGTGWHLDPKIIARAAPAAPTIKDYMGLLLDQAMAYHANTLDYSNPEVWVDQNPEMLARAIANIGYRLRPKEIVFPNTMTDGNETMKIRSTWCNDATGALPNLNRRWMDPKTNRGKYRLAFALFKPGQAMPEKITIDPAPEPGSWVKGTDSTYISTIAWGVPRQAYELGVGIIDTTRPTAPSLDLAVKGLERRNGWYILGGSK